ncbi:MAG: hypothetical protein SOH81_06455 [Acetobacter sp.]|jgi:hypothetical protein
MSIEAIYEADYWHLKIKRFQSDFENQITTLVPDLMEHGYTGEEMIQAELQFFSEGDAKVFFPIYNLTVIATHD